MRKAMLAGLLAATLVPTIAQAQNAELRHDRRDLRDERRDVARDYRDGASMHQIREDRRDVRDAFVPCAVDHHTHAILVLGVRTGERQGNSPQWQLGGRGLGFDQGTANGMH